MRTTATLLIAGFMLTTPATAQDTGSQSEASTTENVKFVAQQKTNQDLVSRFLGTQVVNPGGEPLGRVNDLALNAAGQVEVIVIGVGGFLGVGEKNVGVAYDALARQQGDEGKTELVLDASQGDLTDAPEYLTADNQSLSLTQRLRERAGELTDEAKQTYEKAKDRVMEEAEQLSQ